MDVLIFEDGGESERFRFRFRGLGQGVGGTGTPQRVSLERR